MSAFKYRPEVDGLRALSVLGVLFYHVGLGFPGGFVGVDVFFVISGYLITSLILKDLAQNRFSLADFWVRRIRRIVPALTGMLIAVLLAGAVILLPYDLRDLGKSLLAQSLMGANFFFSSGAGYFDPAVELKPLLHTWSLAVEEQFYLLFPGLLWLLHTQRPTAIRKTLWALTLLSFLASLFGIVWFPLKTFYLLPTRAWELLAGSFLATRTAHNSQNRLRSEFFSWTGLLLIAFPMACYTSTTPFPGATALLPVLGAVLVIATANREENTLGKLLAARPLVFIGLLSYSLYLWHWPLIAFTRYLTPDLSLQAKLTIVSLSFLFAYASWRWIERPFRAPLTSTSKRPIFTSAILTQGITLAAGLLLIFTHGLPQRYSPASRELIAAATPDGAKYSVSTADLKAGKIPLLGSPDAKPSFAILGDSHALALRGLLDQLAHAHQVSGYFIAEGGSIPIPGLATKQLPPHPDLLARGEAAARLINERNIKHLILIARWSAYVEGLSDYDLASDSTRHRFSLLAVDSESREVSPREAPRALHRALTSFMQHHLPPDAALWIVQQVPESKTGIAEIGTKLKLLGLPFHPPLTTKADHNHRQRRANDILYDLQAAGARLLDPTPHFFNAEGQLIVEEKGRFLYRDEDHLTPAGASLRLTPLLDPVLRHIADPRSPAPPPSRTAIQPVDHRVRQ